MTECVREATGFIGYPTYESEGLDLYYLYKHFVASAVQYLRKMEWQWAASVLGALLWEPKVSIQAGTTINKGRVDKFQVYGMNPEVIEDKEKTPTLAFHGKNGSQGMFLPLGKYFQEHDMGPLFTLNLSEGELTERDLSAINAKIDEIQKLYGRKVKINFIGYSLGAELALYAALQKDSWRIEEGGRCFLNPVTRWREEVGKIIRIGSMTLQTEWKMLSDEMKESIYEIRGMDDIHMPEPSYAINQYQVDGVGHVGLVSSSLVFDQLKIILC
ncbi:MAG: hypothetical protein KFB93_04710 [Simkaniaceae bacterium]|nr:MAG: hypothetical protein KFB93_04710 [Simkaniaceae bacterium]